MTSTKKWAVINKKTRKVGYTRESNYHRHAFFATRKQAREALREQDVFSRTDLGRVVKADKLDESGYLI